MISKNTTNASFKEMQYKLQDNDVQNAFFINEIKDTSLDGIDVYEEIAKLGKNTNAKAIFIQKVIKECKNNIWYYFREVVRLPDDFHMKANVTTGLAKYPLNDYTTKFIYLHSLGHSIVTMCEENIEDTDLSFLTMAALGIYYEYINTDRKTAYINTDDIIFKGMMHSLRWAMNDVLGNIDGIYPLDKEPDGYNFKIFNAPRGNVKLDDGKNIFISPEIYCDKDLSNFLDESKWRNYSNSIGRIVQTTEIISMKRCLDIITAYIFDRSFYNRDYTIYDNHTISDSKIYLI